ncbi:hypothetical protein J6I75_05765 [Pseudidiomarina sp. 1APP75-27a]|uniref:hypothetical protein n=1 Tax=Pseudidiomarina terrestris TaxID=2820060 RepID=UPI002B06036E|nr:hypothetical protein [Pseudidiomarina sp. 1APP75-27a]MEA3587855.1 hypothetical protein [Pseudidiomarina sp. 1APP75-27a]
MHKVTLFGIKPTAAAWCHRQLPLVTRHLNIRLYGVKLEHCGVAADNVSTIVE